MTNLLHVYYITRLRTYKTKGKVGSLQLPPCSSLSIALLQNHLIRRMRSGTNVSFHVSFHAFSYSSPVSLSISL